MQRTERIAVVLALANQEAQRMNHDHVDSFHILLGLLKECSGVAGATLRDYTDLSKLRGAVEARWKPGTEDVRRPAQLPLTLAAETLAVNLSVAAARECNHSYVGTEHFLLGALKDEQCVQVLGDLSIQAETVRAHILNLLGLADEKPDAIPAQKPQTGPPLLTITRINFPEHPGLDMFKVKVGHGDGFYETTILTEDHLRIFLMGMEAGRFPVAMPKVEIPASTLQI